MEGLLESLFKKLLGVGYKNDFANVSFKEYKSLVNRNNILYKYCVENLLIEKKELEARVLELRKINDEYILKGVHLLEVYNKNVIKLNKGNLITEENKEKIVLKELDNEKLESIKKDYDKKIRKGKEFKLKLEEKVNRNNTILEFGKKENEKLKIIYDKLPDPDTDKK